VHTDLVGTLQSTSNGERHYLWRAMDQDGHILDIVVQHRRDKHAAKKSFRKLLKGLPYVPRVIITDKLKSYGVPKREILPDVEHHAFHGALLVCTFLRPRYRGDQGRKN
jgi:putative transposase